MKPDLIDLVQMSVDAVAELDYFEGTTESEGMARRESDRRGVHSAFLFFLLDLTQFFQKRSIMSLNLFGHVFQIFQMQMLMNFLEFMRAVSTFFTFQPLIFHYFRQNRLNNFFTHLGNLRFVQ